MVVCRNAQLLCALTTLALCTLPVAALSQGGPGKVADLNKDDFDMIATGPGHLFVMFYAPWCDHCKELKPEFAKAAKMITKAQDDDEMPIMLAKVNAEDNADLAKKYGVEGYPTLRFFKHGEKMPVNAEAAGRTAEEMKEWALRIARAPDRVMEITSGVGMKHFIEEMESSNSVGVIGTFEDKDSADMFLDVAEKCRYPVRFGWTTKPYAWKHLDLEEGQTNLAIMYKPYDEKRAVHDLNGTKEHSRSSKNEMAEMMTKMMGVPQSEAVKLLPEPKPAKELNKWIETQMVPLVVPFTEQFMNLIFTGPVKVHVIVIVDPDDDSAIEDVEDAMRSVAVTRRGEALHILMPALESTEAIRDFFGVGGRALPTAVISDMRGATDEEPQGKQYPADEGMAFDTAGLTEYEDAFFNGDLVVGGVSKKKKKKSKKKKTTGKEL